MYPVRSVIRGNISRTALIVLSSSIVAVSCGDPTDPVDAGDPVAIQIESLAEAIEGQGYSQQLEATGGTGGYSWALAAGTLPVGLTLAPAGAITGTAIAPGTSSFRVQATDARGRSATADLSIEVVQALAIHTSALPEGVLGEAYAAPLVAVGGRGTRSWTVTGEAASWLSVSPSGELSGTPGAAGTFPLTVTVADESGQEGTRQLGIVVFQPVAVADISLPTATEGRVYAAQLVATGGDGAYAWALESGALPTGLALGSAGGLMGTPMEAGEFTFTVRVTDHAERSATRALTLTVERAPTIQTAILPPGEPGEPYAAPLVATGGTGAYTWTITDGALPDGLTVSATGAISGTPTALGSVTFTVRVTDEASMTHTRAFTLVVAEIDELVSGEPATGMGGEAGGVRYFGIEVPAGATKLTVTASGGTGDVDLYVRYGTLPGEFTYDCRPLREGNEEICTFVSPSAGNWYVMLRGHTAYAGVSLVATVEP